MNKTFGREILRFQFMRAVHLGSNTELLQHWIFIADEYDVNVGDEPGTYPRKASKNNWKPCLFSARLACKISRMASCLSLSCIAITNSSICCSVVAIEKEKADFGKFLAAGEDLSCCWGRELKFGVEGFAVSTAMTAELCVFSPTFAPFD